MKKLVIMVMVLSIFACASAFALAETVRIAGHGGNDVVIVEEMINKFVNPKLKAEGISVVYEPITDDYQRYIVNALSAGTGPDLFYMDIFWAESVIKSGKVEPLNKYMDKSKILKAKDFVPSLMKAFTINGQIYGIPKDFNSLAMYYNKDLFDAAKVAYPNDKDTWVTLEEKLKKVSNAAKGIYGLALQPEFARMGCLAYGAGFKPFDAKGKTNLSDPAFKDAFTWFTSLGKKGLGIMPADLGQSWGGGAFATEKVAVCFEGAWMTGFLRDNAPNLRYGCTLMPKAPKNNKRGNFIFTVAWGLNKDSKHKDKAFRVLEILTSPEVQQWVLERGLAIPSRSALANNPYFKQQTPEAQANYIVFKGASDGNVLPYSFLQYGGQWMDPINENLRSVISGQYTVEQGLKEAQTRIDQVMKR